MTDLRLFDLPPMRPTPGMIERGQMYVSQCAYCGTLGDCPACEFDFEDAPIITIDVRADLL